MQNEQEHISALGAASVGWLRSKINALTSSLGIELADGSARLVSYLVVLMLGSNIFFFLNLGLGFLLGDWLGSWGLGFLALVGFYTLVLMLYYATRLALEARVRTRVARRIHYLSDDLNQRLDQVALLRVEPVYRERFISGEPFPYQSLQLRRDEAKRQNERAGQDLREGLQYLRHNYMQIFGSMAQTAVPAYRYVAPVVSLLYGSTTSRQGTAARATMGASKPNFLERHLPTLSPYMPYMRTAYKWLYPVLSSFVIGRTQSWLLGKLMGTKPKRR